MSKRSRQRARQQPAAALPVPRQASGPPPAPEPEQLLLDQIAAGVLDAHLHQVADAIHARIDLLETVNSAKALAMLNVGDRVRFNHHTRPQYLRGVEGVIIELDRDSASVCVHGPIGRFRSGEIRRCPPLLLERLPPAA
ncbi:MAG: hypothetical protein ACLP50_22490 [Solirubrobacteraceae bacterium]